MGKLKPGEVFFTESKWMVRNQRGKIIDYPERLPYQETYRIAGPQFVYFQPGTKTYFQRGQKRYFCEVLRHAGYAIRTTRGICREFKFTYEVKVIE